MKNETTKEQVRETRAALAEVEAAMSAIKTAREADQKKWVGRREELARLESEVSGADFDPNEAGAEQKLAALSGKSARILALRGLIGRDPRAYHASGFEDGRGAALIAATLKLQELVWQIAEPDVELAYKSLRRAGVFVAETGYTPKAGAARCRSWTLNFTEECAVAMARLAREVLSRRLPPLPESFGVQPRALTRDESAFLEAHTETCKPA